MPRRLFTLASALSLLLFAGTLAIWIWSYTASWGWESVRPRAFNSGSLSRGEFLVMGGRFSFDFYSGSGRISGFGAPRRSDWRLRWGGFYYHRQIVGTRASAWQAAVPLWFVAAIFATSPALLFAIQVGDRGKRPYRRHLCTRCGYDLCATPERCPECGTTGRPSFTATAR